MDARLRTTIQECARQGIPAAPVDLVKAVQHLLESAEKLGETLQDLVREIAQLKRAVKRLEITTNPLRRAESSPQNVSPTPIPDSSLMDGDTQKHPSDR